MKNLFLLLLLFTTSFASDTVHFKSQIVGIEIACERNVATACFEYGVLLEKGLGVKKNIKMAKSFYIKACNNGYDEACITLERLEAQQL